MTPEIKINVGDLDAGGKHFQFPLRAAWIRGILEDHEATTAGTDGLLDVRASASGTAIVVHGTLRADLTVPCARCLDPVAVKIDEPLSLLFVPGHVHSAPASPAREAKGPAAKEGKPGGKGPAGPSGPPGSPSLPGSPGSPGRRRKRAEDNEREISSEEADTLPYDGETVVLDDVIRDELILETPIFPLCSEDCPGMSPPPETRSKKE